MSSIMSIYLPLGFKEVFLHTRNELYALSFVYAIPFVEHKQPGTD